MKGLTTRFLKTVWIAALGSISFGLLAIADEQPERVIVKLGAEDLTPAVTKTLADIGIPEKISVSAEETLARVIIRHCGRRDDHFLGLLKEKPEYLEIPIENISFDYVFPNERTLTLPYCLRLSVSTDQPVVQGVGTTSYSGKLVDTPQGKLWLGGAFAATDGPSPYSHVWAGPAASSNEFESPWDMTAYIDSESKTPSADSNEDKPDYIAIAVREGLNAKQGVTALNSDLPKGDEAREAQRGIKHITVLSPSEDKCAPASADLLPEDYPVDTYAVLRVLGLNRLVRPDLAASPLPLIIGDSGLYVDDRAGVFTDAIVQQVKFKERNPNSNYYRSQHGTYVASASLGGPYFMRFLPLLRAPVKVAPKNIISKTQGCQSIEINGQQSSLADYCEIDDVLLTNLVPASTTGGILNLSVSHIGEIEGLVKQLLQAEDKYLLVAAAGNTGLRIVADSYPAQLAQHDKLRNSILVVAALESNGRTLSEQSSYHPAWVEISAYGCRVPVYKYSEAVDGTQASFDVVRQSGTSMAAPLVAFTASLLGEQMNMSPPLLKKRILVAADYEPALNNQVKHNAKLNIPRTLAIFHDVVTLEGKQPIYGKLKMGDFSIPLCGGSDPKLRSELRSLSIYQEKKEEPKRVFYYYGNSGAQNTAHDVLQSGDCSLNKPNPDNEGFDLATQKFTIENAETRVETVFSLGDATNITFAHKPYWED